MSNPANGSPPKSISEILSNYQDTLRSHDIPLDPNQLGDAICALINRSSVDLRLVADVLTDIAETIGDMAADLDATGKATPIELINQDTNAAWVLYDPNEVPRDVYLAARYPTPQAAWREAATSRLTSEDLLNDEGWTMGTATVQIHRYGRLV